LTDFTGDAELLWASADGDAVVFGTLVRRYQTLVCAITYSVTGDVGASEELAQVAFLRVWSNLRHLKDPSTFRPWLCAIARNLAGTAVRRRAESAAESLAGAEKLLACEPGPAEAVLAKERHEVVWTAVQRIPLKYREPLVLFYRHQQSVGEVAADLGLSKAAVRQRLSRGRRLIKPEVASLVEDTLARSGSGKAFAIAVAAALPAVITPTASGAVAGAMAKGAPMAGTVVATGVGGAVLGPILGLLGGILGSWCSIKNTHSPRERRFMIGMTVMAWGMIFVLLGMPLTLTLAGLVPTWSVFVGQGVFFIFLVPLVLWADAHQRNIRIQEGTFHRPEAAPGGISPQGRRVNLAGGIVGATLWLLILAALVRDGVFFGVILGYDVLLLGGLARVSSHRPQWYWSVCLAMTFALMTLTLVVVNLRWNVWMEAYRVSPAYEAVNDVSQRTINVIIVSLYGVIVLLVAWHRTHRRHET